MTPFHFYTRLNLVKLLGIKAQDQLELLEGLKKVPLSSIYYHTHRFIQQHNYLSPEPPNDFAYWLTNILMLKDLGESFASIDTIGYGDLEDLRNQFIRILNESISKEKRVVKCPEGEEFHFMSCVTFIMPTNHVANNPKEFIDILDKISVDALYFHIFEARMRLCRGENDFCAWFRSIGNEKLAKEIAKLDPYTITLEGLRKKIIKLVQRYG